MKTYLASAFLALFLVTPSAFADDKQPPKEVAKADHCDTAHKQAKHEAEADRPHVRRPRGDNRFQYEPAYLRGR